MKKRKSKFKQVKKIIIINVKIAFIFKDTDVYIIKKNLLCISIGMNIYINFRE